MILLFLLLMSRKSLIPEMDTLLIDRTSGLDASIALSVMQVLRDIAATGRTVIGELHIY
jgi:ABC-type multidrug transport system ATPase subunit